MRHAIKDRSWVEIDLSAFRSNLRALKAFLKEGQDFLQIVKADAYGHGAWEIGRVAMEEGACCLGVANSEEGKLLRIQGCVSPILILSPSLVEEIPEIIRYDLASSVSDAEFANALNSAAAQSGKTAAVHLKIDTGMRRSGIAHQDFDCLWDSVQALPHLHVDGLFSHYAASESDPELSLRQLELFDQVIASRRDQVKYVHIANSSALVNGLAGSGNLARLGILSFGVYTHQDQTDKLDLKPVMSFRARLAQIKKLAAGEALGYNLSWTADRDTLYGIVPVGYADGYDFLLSNRGKALINSTVCNVIGRVSMDMVCIDITDCPAVSIGDPVTLLGDGEPALRAENLAASYSGSAYELLCQLGRRARRYYMEEGLISHSAPLARRDFVSTDFNDSKLNQIIQSAISQRLQSEEIGELISREILRSFFFNRDKDIHYRKSFEHTIRLEDSDKPGYWRAFTRLSFKKILQNDYFIVACANSDEALQQYFKRKDVEYRWLMDDSFVLNPAAFEITDVHVDGLRLETRSQRGNNCLEITCRHDRLKDLVGKEVSFTINTLSWYPRSSHQLSVFINELTHGVKVSLEFPETLKSLEVVPVFSGQNRYPDVIRRPDSVTVSTRPDQWVFPLSGVVFAY